MKRSERLGLVLDLADKALKKAADVVESARQQLLTEQQKLEDLEHYYNDYSHSFAETLAGIRAQDVARQRAFLGQLSDAQKQQQLIVNQRGQLVANKQKLWHLAYLKQRAIEQLIQRLQKDETAALTRKEEKRLDEWSLQASARKINREKSEPPR